MPSGVLYNRINNSYPPIVILLRCVANSDSHSNIVADTGCLDGGRYKNSKYVYNNQEFAELSYDVPTLYLKIAPNPDR